MNNPFKGMTESSIFPNGAEWLRVDFHLHTAADSEFAYNGDAAFYNSSYVDSLARASIRLAVITNHNKFDVAEFRALRSTAQKKSIALLPGVELSVDDGANGVHTLIVFSDEWLAEGHDYINSFLGVAFEGKPPAQYQRENARARCSAPAIPTPLPNAPPAGPALNRRKSRRKNTKPPVGNSSRRPARRSTVSRCVRHLKR